MSGRRNPVLLIGERPRDGFTIVCNEIIRAGAHPASLGTDGVAVMLLLLSSARPQGSKRPWETSARAIAEQFGWGRERVRNALHRAVEDERLIIRECRLDGRPVLNRSIYVVCAGGRRFTDEERTLNSTPIELKSTRRGVAA